MVDSLAASQISSTVVSLTFQQLLAPSSRVMDHTTLAKTFRFSHVHYAFHTYLFTLRCYQQLRSCSVEGFDDK